MKANSKVDFNYQDMLRIFTAKVTDGNISAKTFHVLVDKIEGANNVPDSVFQAVQKKAETHPELQGRLSSAYDHRTDAQYTAEIEKQQEILKNSDKTPENYINESFCIAKNVVEKSGESFRLLVAAYLQPCKNDHTTTSETYNKLDIARNRLRESEKNLEKLKKQILEETRRFTPEQEKDPDSYIKQWYGKDLQKINNLIEKNTSEIAALSSMILEQRELFTQTVFALVNEKPSLINHRMKSHLTELENLNKYYQALPDIRMNAESKIEELTKQREENKNKTGDIKNTSVKDGGIKLSDTPTHKTQSTLTDKITNVVAVR